MISIYFGIDPNEVMEGVIDDPFHINLLENFLNKSKAMCLFFFYQDGPPFQMGKNIVTDFPCCTLSKI